MVAWALLGAVLGAPATPAAAAQFMHTHAEAAAQIQELAKVAAATQIAELAQVSTATQIQGVAQVAAATQIAGVTAAELVLADTGACTADDATKINTVKFACDATSCAKKSFFKLDGTTKCIETTDGVSSGCANCFGQVAQCVLKNCALKCLTDPTAPACLSCGHAACDELGKTCTGQPIIPDCKSGVEAAAEMVLADTGACTADDATKINTVKFACDATSCAKKSFFKLDGTTKCIETTDGVSSGCANCFGQVAQCVLKHCALKCLTDPTAPACLSCGHAACDELGKACTGQPPIPDPQNCNGDARFLVV